MLVGYVYSDVYLHNPRGSNNRLDEQGRERANANRMFDSQNNNRGGYNVGSLYYYKGSDLAIEWTNQHSCGEKNSHCELIIQYMCDDQLRDGTKTRTIPETRSQCAAYDCNSDLEYGMNENYNSYMNCKFRQRNKGLFTADQKLKRDSAKYTRQNPNGNRRGYECPEERDYYPYWLPTAWKDIAIMTNNVSHCEYYQSESQNTKSKFSCTPPAGYLDYLIKRGEGGAANRLIPITKADCETLVYNDNNGTWTETKPWGLPEPACIFSPKSRDNHNGNGPSGFPNMFNWTIFDTPHEHCALRLRYNISTGDYDGMITDSRNNNNSPNPPDIASLVGLTPTKAIERGYIFKNNPKVNPLQGDIGKRLQLELAINTAQYGRTFQDRSHAFAIRSRPDNLKSEKIHNLNVRGKRGNIVQVYPAVEYDFVPNRLSAGVNDYIHFQWTGSNTNPKNNDGQGLAGTDRSNVVLLTKQNYPEGTPGKAVQESLKFGHFGNNYPAHLYDVTLLGLQRQDLINLALVGPGQFRGSMNELDDAGTYFDLGPRKITQSGTYHYMCSRNNNFSNRGQKGKIVVSASQGAEKQIGWSGGAVMLADSTQGVWVPKAAVQKSVNIRIEEWSKEVGEAHIKKQGGSINIGDGYDSKFFAVYPFGDIAEGKDVTMKLKVTSSSTNIYQSVDYRTWRKVPNVAINNKVAEFKASRGGVYVARTPSDQKRNVIIGVVVGLLVLVILVIGVVVYCRKRPETMDDMRKTYNEIRLGVKSKV